MPAKKQSKSQKFINGLFYTDQHFDYVTFFIIVFLVCFGLVMVYSTSSYKATTTYGDPAYYVKRQAIVAIAGLVIMLIISNLNYRKWKNFTWLLYVLTVGLLVVVLAIGASSHGAVRWIRFGSFQFQPSEVAKFVLILFTAHYATSRSRKLGKIKDLIAFMIVPIIPIGLVATENLSTAIVCACIVVGILFVTSPLTVPFFAGGGLAAAAVYFILKLANDGNNYRWERIEVWQNIETHPKGYQTRQAMYAIGSGGLWGKGLGQSIQKMGFVPESHNDMIFSIVCEELGLFGAICIIAVFALLIWRFMQIANSAPDLYGALIVVGVLVHIAIQVLINIAVVTNTIPPTGVTLPFISYGGTSMLMLLAEMGLVLAVSRQIKYGR